LLVAIVALVAAIGGSAIARPGADASRLSKAEVKRLAVKEAKREIARAAGGLSVANAQALEGKPASAFALAESEPVHLIGAPGEPEFVNEWKNTGVDTSRAGFFRDPLGFVHLEGTIDTGSNGDTAFELPEGYRPSQALLIDAAGFGPKAANVTIVPQGDVMPACDGGCRIGLDGISFRAG
jgi:hypothetical protein